MIWRILMFDKIKIPERNFLERRSDRRNVGDDIRPNVRTEPAEPQGVASLDPEVREPKRRLFYFIFRRSHFRERASIK